MVPTKPLLTSSLFRDYFQVLEVKRCGLEKEWKVLRVWREEKTMDLCMEKKTQLSESNFALKNKSTETAPKRLIVLDAIGGGNMLIPFNIL